MNIVLAESSQILKDTSPWPIVTLLWWHLVDDNLNFFQIDIRWSATQSLASPRDRASLKNFKELCFHSYIYSLKSYRLLRDHCQLIKEKRENSYNLALPLLLDQLVRKLGPEIELLWKKISFGPSKFFNKAEKKALNSDRW